MICPRETFAAACVLILVAPVILLQSAAEPAAPSANVKQARPPQPPRQSPQAPDDPRARIRARTELVVVPVTVKSDSGQLVTGRVSRPGRWRRARDRKSTRLNSSHLVIS